MPKSVLNYFLNGGTSLGIILHLHGKEPFYSFLWTLWKEKNRCSTFEGVNASITKLKLSSLRTFF